MTLVVSLTSRHAVWLLADRRITWPEKEPLDTAMKALVLHANDGRALLAYSGLGETIGGTQPSEWMRQVLTGWDMSMNDAMWWLAHQCQQHIPPHLDDKRLSQHLVLAPAVAEGDPRLYVVGANAAGQVAHQRKRLSGPDIPTTLNLTPRFLSSGTGGVWLDEEKESREELARCWVRRLLSLSNKYDRGRVSAVAVADMLAGLNLVVHSGLDERAASSTTGKPASVGPDCVVLWLSRCQTGELNEGVQFYERATRAGNDPVPTATSQPNARSLGNLLLEMTHDLDDLETRASARRAERAGGRPFIPDNKLS